MRFLVTGARGFIGSHVCRDLLARGASVRGLRRNPAPAPRLSDVEARIDWHDCDLLTASAAELEAAAAGIDACIHTAWDVAPGRYLTSPANALYREASLRLFDALALRGCRHITGVGTCFEYMEAPHPLDESSPLGPTTPYAREKLATFLEADGRLRHTQTGFTWARLFYLYGPGENPRRLVPDVVTRLLKGERAEVTRGRQVRDFLHVADAAHALVALTPGSARGAVNVGSGDPVRVIHVVETIGRLVGRADLIAAGARPENLVDPPYVCADNRRLRQETDWSPRFGLVDGLEDTIAWWRAALRSCEVQP